MSRPNRFLSPVLAGVDTVVFSNAILFFHGFGVMDVGFDVVRFLPRPVHVEPALVAVVLHC